MEIPVNTCNFKVELEVKHEMGHYCRIKFDWIDVHATTKEITFPDIDTGFLKEWTLLQIEGEDPIEVESQEALPLGKSPSKAPPKRPELRKPTGKPAALEEITEQRPMTVKFERDFALENNGVGLEISEDVAVKFSEAVLNLQVFETNRETMEETLTETI